MTLLIDGCANTRLVLAITTIPTITNNGSIIFVKDLHFTLHIEITGNLYFAQNSQPIHLAITNLERRLPCKLTIWACFGPLFVKLSEMRQILS